MHARHHCPVYLGTTDLLLPLSRSIKSQRQLIAAGLLAGVSQPMSLAICIQTFLGRLLHPRYIFEIHNVSPVEEAERA
jgi:hypothetical protein